MSQWRPTDGQGTASWGRVMERMVEPEDRDLPLRRVFEELEAEFEAGLRHEAEQEAVAAIRADVGATPLWEQLARRIGADGVVRAGSRTLRGTVVAATPTSSRYRDTTAGST